MEATYVLAAPIITYSCMLAMGRCVWAVVQYGMSCMSA